MFNFNFSTQRKTSKLHASNFLLNKSGINQDSSLALAGPGALMREGNDHNNQRLISEIQRNIREAKDIRNYLNQSINRIRDDLRQNMSKRDRLIEDNLPAPSDQKVHPHKKMSKLSVVSDKPHDDR